MNIKHYSTAASLSGNVVTYLPTGPEFYSQFCRRIFLKLKIMSLMYELVVFVSVYFVNVSLALSSKRVPPICWAQDKEGRLIVYVVSGNYLHWGPLAYMSLAEEIKPNSLHKNKEMGTELKRHNSSNIFRKNPAWKNAEN